MLTWFFSGIWSKFVAIIVGAIGLVVALFGLRYRIRAHARAEVEAEMMKRTIERMRHAEIIEHDGDGLHRDDVLSRLRDKGLLRD